MVVTRLVFGSVLLVALVFSAAGLQAVMAVAVARRTRDKGGLLKVTGTKSRYRLLYAEVLTVCERSVTRS